MAFSQKVSLGLVNLICYGNDLLRARNKIDKVLWKSHNVVFHDLSLDKRLDFLLSLPVRVGISFGTKKHRELSQLAVNTKKYV